MPLLIHVKCLRSNFFVIISFLGYVLFSQSSGNLGFQDTQKRTKDALLTLLTSAFEYIQKLKTKATHIFLKVEGAIKSIFFKQIKLKLLRAFTKKKIKLIGFQLVNKTSHNGCRKSIRRK